MLEALKRTYRQDVIKLCTGLVSHIPEVESKEHHLALPLQLQKKKQMQRMRESHDTYLKYSEQLRGECNF